jgi:hypothetical protein
MMEGFDKMWATACLGPLFGPAAHEFCKGIRNEILRPIEIDVNLGIHAGGGKQPPPGVARPPSSPDIKHGKPPESDGKWANLDALPRPCAFEDFVAAFMMDVAKQQMDEVREKMGKLQELAAQKAEAKGAKEGGGAAGGAPGGAAGGAAGGAGGGLGALMGGGGGGGGGMAGLAGMFGGGGGGAGGMKQGLGMISQLAQVASPMLMGCAPYGTAIALCLQIGLPIATQIAGQALDQMESSGKKQASGAGGGSGKAGGAQGAQGGKAPDKEEIEDSRQLLFEQMKNSMNRLQQMMQALSNVLNSMHEGSMASIRNIK